ncbi:hypothetical protein HPB48_013425 [Haemaphysalis longicornis]|uniref:Uncharacterized protein n=1 Tax=Haemaphysalis longicornis TaxID=44386 RepID=A0A9J6FBP2_HAELO|nr:hypothetical protein HPB48_013425 [Haemaphysalis longicornis]
MSGGSRRQFTAALKLKAIEPSSRMGIWRCNASLAFRRKVRYWRSQKAKLCACNPRNRSFRRCQAMHPVLENKVADFIRGLRSRSLPVTAEAIRGPAPRTSLPDDMDARAFSKCSISNALDGTEDASEKQSSSDDSDGSDDDQAGKLDSHK